MQSNEKVNVNTKKVIAGFPGVGKSTAAKLHPDIFIDLESSDYHWIKDKNGNNVCDPDWPMNYVAKIIVLMNVESSHKYILISTHNEVLTELNKRYIPFEAVLPKTKSKYIERYKKRKNTEAFIAKLTDNFDAFVASVFNANPVKTYMTDGYLENIFVSKASKNPGYTVSINPNCFPLAYTDKLILLVYDNKMFSKDPMDIDNIDFIDESEYIDDDGDHVVYSFHELPYNRMAADIVYRACIESSSPYIVAYACPELIEIFHANKINFILAVPKTCNEKSRKESGSNAKIKIRDAVKSAFQVIRTDNYLDDILFIPTLSNSKNCGSVPAFDPNSIDNSKLVAFLDVEM